MSASHRRVFGAIGAVAVALGVGGGILWWGLKPESADSPGPAPASSSASVQESTSPFARFEAGLKHIDDTVWSRELLAQECGRTLELFWDSLNPSSNRWAVIREFDPGPVTLGSWSGETQGPLGIRSRASQSGGRELGTAEWKEWVAGFERAGWTIDGIELRHRAFDAKADGSPDRSRWSLRIDATHAARGARATVQGEVGVTWGDRDPATGRWRLAGVDASRLQLTFREGPAGFAPVLSEAIEPLRKGGAIDPILVHDLDGDGFPEVLLPAVNRVYSHTASGGYVSRPLVKTLPTELLAAVMTDLDADGVADLIGADRNGLLMWRGLSGGAFADPPRRIWSPSLPMVNPAVIAAADLNHDGRIDLFIGQYRVPTIGQILSPSFHAANDGHPAFLLIQDSEGGFRDATDSAGLSARRHRRVYSAVFGDFGGGSGADLALVSDFAGIDLFSNDGAGRFTEITARALPESHAFGMGTAVADFNGDGRLDLLMIGMNSSTVDRLDHLGLRRPDDATDPTLRGKMTWGNRLYLAQPDGRFSADPHEAVIARSGWAWGVAAADFDNDSRPDLYIVNGHVSGRTVQDYESEFWLHDIYIDRSVDDRTATSYFMRKHGATRGDGWSYGGYERNRLYLNRGTEGYQEAGHPLGVAMPEDCRNAVSADLDGDGREDLIVTTLEVWPVVQQTLRIYRNALPTTGHWIGFRFERTSRGVPVEGTRVRLTAGGRTRVSQVVNGDSFRSQQPLELHFGLGAVTEVESAQILWPDGTTQTLAKPFLDRWNTVRAPVRK
jgi:hypothetical protein